MTGNLVKIKRSKNLICAEFPIKNALVAEEFNRMPMVSLQYETILAVAKRVHKLHLILRRILIHFGHKMLWQ